MHISRASWDLPKGATVVRQQDRLAHFFELDDLESSPLALCRLCKGCASCSYRKSTMSPAELESVQIMEDGMAYNEEENVINVVYPFRDCADSQPNNYKQVRKIQESIEGRLLKDGQHESFVAEMQKMVAAGTVARLDKEE